MRKRNIEEIENAVHYSFKDKSLLEEAFTHLSANNAVGKNYERFEFLGDSLINLVIADYFFNMYPDYSEGQLTQMKAHVVNGKTLARMSKKLHLGDYLSIGKGLLKQGVSDSIYSDIIEALCAAVFLDAGIRFARDFVINLFQEELDAASAMTKDSKSRLQELVQKQSSVCPAYDIVDVSGDDHNKVFSATVTVSGILFGPCQGKTKKQSEQNAALLALKALTQ